jgi:hypothetical protein
MPRSIVEVREHLSHANSELLKRALIASIDQLIVQPDAAMEQLIGDIDMCVEVGERLFHLTPGFGSPSTKS